MEICSGIDHLVLFFQPIQNSSQRFETDWLTIKKAREHPGTQRSCARHVTIVSARKNDVTPYDKFARSLLNLLLLFTR